MLPLYLAMPKNPKDESKLKQIYEQYKYLLYNQAYKILKDHQQTEDAIHNTFLVLINNLHKINDVNCNKTRNFLIIIIRNESFKLYNEIKGMESYDDIVEDTEPDSYDLETDVESRDTQKRVMEMIKSLHKKYADVLMLKFFYEYSDAEIAETLGITVDNARVRISRGRTKLKQMIKEAMERDEF